MAFNELMHPRNIFKKKKPNFKELAIKYPEFRKHAVTDLKGNVHLDFKKPECLMVLSWALLKEEFGLDIEILPDRLIPTIPLRLNYILWVEDLIGSEKQDIRIIDIGTGSCCIYPLLGAKKNNWSFLASELDAVNFTYAQKNVEKNGLQDKIKVVKVCESTVLAALLRDSDLAYDVCMCNPPFFGSNLEAWGITQTRNDDRHEPSSISTATPGESIILGGEVQFIKKLIDDSLLLKTQVRIYTTMLGKKSSLAPLKQYLKVVKITNFGHTEFCQGKTMRWGLAWSFDSSVNFPVAPSKMLRKQKEKLKPKPPISYKLPSKMDLLPDMNHSVHFIGSHIMTMLDQLQIIYEPEKSSSDLMVLQLVATHNTWSHQRRKRRQKMLSPERQKKNHIKTVETMTGDHSPKLEAVKCDSSGVKLDHLPKLEAVKCDPSGVKLDHSAKLEAVNCDTSGVKLDHSPELEAVKFDPNGVKLDDNQNKADMAVTAEGGDMNVMNISIEDVTDYIVKCMLSVKKDADDILLEMQWEDGTSHQSMHEIMQYFKNKLK